MRSKWKEFENKVFALENTFIGKEREELESGQKKQNRTLISEEEKKAERYKKARMW